MEKTAPKLLRHWLNIEGRKIKWLAEQISATPSTVSLWVNGRQMPLLEHRKKLESVTGLPIAREEDWL